MQKIGLLTFHQVTNYGAILQCYALRKKILQLGYKCDIIPYSCKKLKQNEKIFKINKNIVVSLAKIISQYGGNKKKKNTFNTFLREKCGMTKIIKKNIDWNYDIIIVGSDQVWNIKLTDKDYTYFLQNNNMCKKISYAASFGEDDFYIDELKPLIPYLIKFNTISVREKHAQGILNSVGINNVITVCDPVLLLEKENWTTFIKKERRIKEPYVLIYCIEKSQNVFQFARKKAKELGAKIIYLNQNLIRENQDFIYIRGASPTEFLNYIYYAQYIVTNSFHGTAFSIIFNKDFAVDKLWHGKDNVRVKEIIENLNLNNRTIQYLNNKRIISDIKYDAVNKKLEIIRKESQQYLLKALQ